MTSTITIGDKTNWTKGSYLAYLSPWGAGSLVKGVDYNNSLTLTADLFPNNVTMSWDWPDTPPKTAGVYNFNAIDFGNYYGTVVKSPIPALQVNNIGVLNQSHSLSLGGDASKYNVITDFWLTEKPGDFNHRMFEVEVFLHTPASSSNWANSLTQLGTYTGSGHNWQVAITSGGIRDIIFLPKDTPDVLTGAVDIKGMLDWLTTHHVISGNEYFNGLGMGVEVIRGAGSMSIDKFNVDYKDVASVPLQTPSVSVTPVVVTPDVAVPPSAPLASTVVTNSAPSNGILTNTSVTPALAPILHEVYRFFDTQTGDHFYTTSAAEKAQIQASMPTFNYEGAPWSAPEKSVNTHDVFRFYDTKTGTHFFTDSVDERDTIQVTIPNYKYEGVAFEAYNDANGAGHITLERFYNTQSGQHHYAGSADEAAGINRGAAGPGWIDEGKAFTVHVPSDAMLFA